MSETELLSANLAHMMRKLALIISSLTDTVRDKYDGLITGIYHMRSIKHVASQSNVQATNARRKIIDVKREVISNTLQLLQNRRRRSRLEKVCALAKHIVEVLKINDDAYEAMSARNFMAATTLSHAAHLSLVESSLSRIIILDVTRRDVRGIFPKLSSIVDDALKCLIQNNTVFDESKYSEIVSVYATLDETNCAEAATVSSSRVIGLSKRIKEHAIARIDAASSFTIEGSIATKAVALSIVAITLIKIIYDAAVWHGASPSISTGEEFSSLLGDKLATNSRVKSRTNSGRVESVRHSLLRIVNDIFYHARGVIIRVIAVDVPVKDHRGVDEGRRRSRLADIVLALEALEAVRRFSMIGNSVDPDTDLQDLIYLPYLKVLQADTLDGLKQMLTCEPWICVDTSGKNDSMRAFSSTVIRAEFQATILNAAAFNQTLSLLDERTSFRWEAHVSLLDHEVKKASHRQMLFATQAAFHGVQRSAVQYVLVVALLKGVKLLTLETLFENFETYLAAVAAKHLSYHDAETPSYEQSSIHLTRLAKAVYCRQLGEVRGLAEVEGAVIAAESLLFARDALLHAVKSILKYDLRHTNRGATMGKLKTATSLALELRSSVHRVVGSRLVGAPGISWAINSLGATVWLTNTIKEECNLYVHAIVTKLRGVWASLSKANDGALSHSNLKELIWTNAMQASFEALVDGFAMIHKCSTEGRALMSMDLQVLQFSLDKIQPARPLRGAAYVDSYIKAWYFDDHDLRTWITQNDENYHKRHLSALLKARETKTWAYANTKR